MLSTAAQVKNIILKHHGRAPKQQIARELRMGLEYVGLICRELERKGELVFRDGFYSLITSNHKPAKVQSRKIRRSLRPRSKVSGHEHKQKKPKKKPISNVHKESVLLAIPKMTEKLVDVLEGVGYRTIESLADAHVIRFMQETKLELHEAAGLINQAKRALNKIGE